MSSEAGPSAVYPTDGKGKRKRAQSPSHNLRSKKVYFPKYLVIETMPLTHSPIVQGYESAPEGVSRNRFTQGKAPEPIETSAQNHTDHTFDDLGNFRNFLRDSRDEAELAVYLGLRHKHDLRHFALSWPIIKTWLTAPHKQTTSLKVEINHLIQDGKELSCIEDPYQVWPERPWESEENASVRITHIMAWHLVQMSKDIEEYTMSSDLHNFHRTRRYRGELSAILELEIPLDNIFHPRPQLISWRNELSDRFDRCWTILGYVSWIPYMKSWEKALEFFVSSKNKAIIYDSGMPTGTRPRPNDLRLAQQCSSSRLAEGPKGPVPIQVKVIWDRNQNTNVNMDLCRVLAGIAHEGKVLPPTDQMMTQDPRACRTGASFRDIIRHMMSCGGYGLNLCDMTLSYHAEADNFYYQIDAFRSQWKVLQGVFSDPANSNFVIRVLLDVHDFRNGEVYETTELPPVY